MFGLDYFGRRAYLAQSPQFYKQALVGVFERVYEIGPVFRAEPHDTARHLAQYTSLDAEFGFITDHQDVMAVLREVFAGMVAGVRGQAAAAAELAGAKLPEVPATIPQLHFADAQELIAQPPGGTRAASRTCPPPTSAGWADWALREHGSEFLFVTGYPMAKRPFYTHPDPARPGLLEQLRPALPRARAGHRRAAAAPARGLPGGAGRARRGPGALRGLPAGVRARHAAARRLRDRARALDRAADRRRQRPLRSRCSRATCTA